MKSILIADDEAFLRFLVRTTLNLEEYEFHEAQDGEHALRLAREGKPDLVILDWKMPGMSGIEVLDALRRDRETFQIPVIMLTGRHATVDRTEAQLRGISAYLVKPFSPLELVESVERVLAC